MARIIDVKVRDKIAVAEKVLYVCGNSDFVINFDFDDEWSEFVHKTARFVYNGTFIDVVFDGNRCSVPIMSNAHFFVVGVYAGNLCTTTPARVVAEKSILCGSNPPAEPTPDVYAQMVELFNAGLDESRINANASESAKNAAVEAKEAAEKSAELAEAAATNASQSETNSKTSEDNAKASEEAAAKSAEEAKADAESAAQSKADAEKAKKSAAASANSADMAYETAWQSMFYAQSARDEAKTHAATAADHAAAAGMYASLVANDADRATAAAETASMGADAASEYTNIAKEHATIASESAMVAKASEDMAATHAGAADMYASVASGCATDARAAAEAAEAAKVTSLQALDALLMVDTATGKVATTECAAAMPIRKLTVNGSTAVEAVKVIGKNFFHRDYTTPLTHIGITATWDAENQEFILNGTTTSRGDLKLVDPMPLDWVAGEKYAVSVRHVGGTATLASGAATTTYSWGVFQNNAAKYVRGSVSNPDFVENYNFAATAFAPDAGRGYIFYFQCWRPGTVFNNYRVKVQIERGTNVTEWEAYREESVALADLNTLTLHKGLNNIIPSPSADITVEYNMDTKLYIDSKIAAL